MREQEHETTGGNETEAPLSKEVTLTIARGGESDFVILYPRSAGVSLRRAANALAECFAKAGIPVEVHHDGGSTAGEIPQSGHEILLGRTNRQESKAAMQEEIPEIGYRMFATENRVGIVATDEEQIETAALGWLGSLAKSARNGDLTVTLPRAETVDWDSGRREGWLLCGIPSYADGKLGTGLYNCGSVLSDYSVNAFDNAQMQTVSGTEAAEYEAYLDLLEKNGYTHLFRNRVGENRYTLSEKGGLRLYSYFVEAGGTVRIIRDKSGVSMTDFGYSYVPAETDSTVFYAYALCQSDTGLQENNCGQLDVIKLADNSLFVIDGGMAAQFDQAAINGFVEFAHRVTGVPKGEPVRISCWFFTHDHGDHREGLAKCLGTVEHRSDFEIERLMFNFPAESKDSGLVSRILSMYPDCRILKPHTGMQFRLADMQIEVVTTHENLALRTGKSSVRDFNDTSTVLKLTAGGVRIMILGDTATLSETWLVEHLPADYLRADIVQVAHHTWNRLDRLYDAIRAPYAVFTQTEGASHRTLGINALAVLQKVQEYAAPEHCYFSGVETTGLLLKDGTVSVKENFPLAWNTPDYPWKDVYEGVDMRMVKDYAVVSL